MLKNSSFKRLSNFISKPKERNKTSFKKFPNHILAGRQSMLENTLPHPTPPPHPLPEALGCGMRRQMQVGVFRDILMLLKVDIRLYVFHSNST